MNSCAYYQELISTLIDGEISREEHEALMIHMNSCSRCNAMYALFHDLSDVLSDEAEPLPEGLHENIMAGVRRSDIIRKNRRMRKLGLRTALSAAACAVLVLFAATTFEPGKRAESVSVRSAEQAQQLLVTPAPVQTAQADVPAAFLSTAPADAAPAAASYADAAAGREAEPVYTPAQPTYTAAQPEQAVGASSYSGSSAYTNDADYTGYVNKPNYSGFAFVQPAPAPVQTAAPVYAAPAPAEEAPAAAQAETPAGEPVEGALPVESVSAAPFFAAALPAETAEETTAETASAESPGDSAMPLLETRMAALSGAETIEENDAANDTGNDMVFGLFQADAATGRMFLASSEEEEAADDTENDGVFGMFQADGVKGRMFLASSENEEEPDDTPSEAALDEAASKEAAAPVAEQYLSIRGREARVKLFAMIGSAEDNLPESAVVTRVVHISLIPEDEYGSTEKLDVNIYGDFVYCCHYPVGGGSVIYRAACSLRDLDAFLAPWLNPAASPSPLPAVQTADPYAPESFEPIDAAVEP